MKERGGRKVKNIDADLDEEVLNYQPSDSDDGLDDNDRELLNNAVGRRKNTEEEEVLKVYESEDNSSENEDASENEDDMYGGEVGSDMDSDIDGKGEDDGLPDSKAWGSDRKQYYDTDYVDKDYLGFDDEEAANEEEKEADALQRRLMSHLEGTDYTLGLLDSVEDKKKQASLKRKEPEIVNDDEIVEVDLSKLSAEELLDLVKRKSPEMLPIVDDCKKYVQYLKDKVLPILKFVDSGELKKTKIVDYFEVMHTFISHYALNVLFYLHLKEAGVRTSDHPVVRRISGLQLILKDMDVLKKKIDPQIEMVFDKVKNGEDLLGGEEEVEKELPAKNRYERRKRKFEFLKKKEELINQKTQKLMNVHDVYFKDKLENGINKPENKTNNVIYSEESESERDDKAEEENEEGEGQDKRAITFEMMKNKGLTPKRKKENRNPRVKHRNKFKKALVRRKGQVREPRKELTKYGGEISGIKTHITKSIKLK